MPSVGAAMSVGWVLCLVVAVATPVPIPQAEGLTDTEPEQMVSSEEQLINLANTGRASNIEPEASPIPADTKYSPESIVQSDTDKLSELNLPEEGVRLSGENELFYENIPISLQGEMEQQSDEPQESYYYPPQEAYSREEEERLASMDLSPRAVAEYILLSGDVSSFEQAITDLVDEGILSEEDVSSYREAVGIEYEAMLRDVMEEEDYLQIPERQSPLYNTMSELPYSDSDGYPLANIVDLDDVATETEMRRVEDALEQEDSLTQLLETLLDYYEEGQEQDIDEDAFGSLPESPAAAAAAAANDGDDDDVADVPSDVSADAEVDTKHLSAEKEVINGKADLEKLPHQEEELEELPHQEEELEKLPHLEEELELPHQEEELEELPHQEEELEELPHQDLAAQKSTVLEAKA